MGKINPRPFTKDSQQSKTKKAALISETFQLCSWLARLLMMTSRNSEIIKPSGFRQKPKITTAPMMMARILKLKLATSVSSALGRNAVSKITAPNIANKMPSQREVAGAHACSGPH